MAAGFLFKKEGEDNALSLSTFSSPAAHQQPGQAFNEGAPFAASYYQEIHGWPLRANIRQSRRRSSCRRAVLALMASVAALLMLITVCSFAGREKEKRRNSAAVRLFLDRKLSEENNAASLEPLEVCGGMQEASDGEFRAESSAGSAKPLTKKRKTKEGDSRSGEGTGGPSEASPPFERKRKATAERKHSETKPKDDSSGALAYSLDWPGTPTPFVQFPLSSDVQGGLDVYLVEFTETTSPAERPLSEGAASHALLLLQHLPLVSTNLAEEVAQEVELEPQPSTSAAVSGQPLPSGSIPFETQQQALAVAPQPQPMAAGALTNHSFCRLPPLQPGVVARAFNPLQVSNRRFVPPDPRTLLLDVRKLLLKDSLCQKDANQLVLLTEGLAAHCYFFERTQLPSRRVDQAADMLAFRFMVLDAMAAALTATAQQPPAAWWQQFAELIPHDMSHTPQSEHCRKRRKSYYGQVARKFSRALGTLKQGSRPATRELYELKYILFCTSRSLPRFRGPLYDPWRTDCDGSDEGS